MKEGKKWKAVDTKTSSVREPQCKVLKSQHTWMPHEERTVHEGTNRMFGADEADRTDKVEVAGERLAPEVIEFEDISMEATHYELGVQDTFEEGGMSAGNSGADACVDADSANKVSGLSAVGDTGREGSQRQKHVSEDLIRAYVGGKKPRITKGGTNFKVKDIDNYLKLFINAHHLP